MDPAGGAVEHGIAEAEDPAVGSDEPVALAGDRRRHADDRLVEPQVAGRPVEAGGAEGEHASVPAQEPVPLARRVPGEADDRSVQSLPDGAARVGQIAERDDLAQSGRDPVAGGSDRDA